MTKKINITILIASVLLGGILGFYYIYSFTGVFGATTYEGPCYQTATATTSYTTIRAGLATTTLTCNVSGASQILADLVDVNFWVVGSSSPLTSIKVTPYWSDARTNNESFYPELVPVNELATSTRLTGDAREYVFSQTASSTLLLSGGASATTSGTIRLENTNRARKLLLYVTVPPGGSNIMFWAEVVVKKSN